MRLVGRVFVAFTLAGCSALRDSFSAHPEVAGRAAGQSLTVARLADLAGNAPKVPLRPDVLNGLATLYLDYTVFAVELARGRDLADSSLVLQANWPDVAQRRWERFHDRLVTARATLSRDQTDSAYRAGDVRLFQHILVRVTPTAKPAETQQKEHQAKGLWRQVQADRGATFVQLAKRHSDDPGSKSRGGYLPPAARGSFVPAFDTAAWALAPGAMSGVVRSSFGFHIIRRPPLEEVRDSFRVELETTLAARLDSAFIDSLGKRSGLSVESAAPALVRQTLPHLLRGTEDGRKLATYRGGAFRVKDLTRWLLAIGPREASGLAMGTDDQLTQFVQRLAERDLLLQQVDSAGVELTAEDWREVKTQHDAVVTALRNALALTPALLKDSAATEEARIRLAMSHVDDYLDRAFKTGVAELSTVPPFLALALRPGQEWSFNEAGITRAYEQAQAMRARADSLRPGGTGLRPAPGPVPVRPDTSKRTSP